MEVLLLLLQATLQKYEILDTVNYFKEDEILIINNANQIRPFNNIENKNINYLYVDNSHLSTFYQENYKYQKQIRLNGIKNLFFILLLLQNRKQIFYSI